MAKFTAPVDLKIRLPGGFEVNGATGVTHRIPDSLVEEFIRDQVPVIPGGVTWVTQDEMTYSPGSFSTEVLTVRTVNTNTIYADQYSSLQAAVNAVPATGGTVIVSSNWTIAAAVTVTTAGTIIRGVTPTAGITFTSTTIDGFAVSGARSMIADISISGPTTSSTTGRGIAISASDCRVERVRVSGTYRAIFADAGDRGVISGCSVSAFVNSGIQLAGALNQWTIIGNNAYSGCTSLTGADIGAGILLNTTSNSIVANNHCFNNGTSSTKGGAGILLNAAAYNTVVGNRCTINGNATTDVNGQGILLAGSGGSRYNTVVGNFCSGNAAEGITVFQQGSKFNTVQGNVCAGNRLNQIEVYDSGGYNTVAGNICADSASSNGIFVYLSPHCTVADNICRNNAQNGIQVNASEYVTVRGNDCTDNNQANSTNTYEGSGITFNGASPNGVVTGNLAIDTAVASARKQLYGAIFINTSSAAVISSNQFSANKTGAIQNGVGDAVDAEAAISCAATRSSTQTLTNNSFTSVQFNATDTYDPYGFHDPATNNTRLTVPSGFDGTYVVEARITIANVSAAGTTRNLNLLKNGSSVGQFALPGVANTFAHLMLVKTLQLVAGDYVEIQAYQDSGISTTIDFSSGAYPVFSITRVGK